MANTTRLSALLAGVSGVALFLPTIAQAADPVLPVVAVAPVCNVSQPWVGVFGATDFENGGAGGEFFLPLMRECDQVIFGFGRGVWLDDGIRGGDAGIGGRWLINPDTGFGVNASAGYWESEYGTDAWRGTVGVEVFTGRFDAHVNLHIADTDDETVVMHEEILNPGAGRIDVIVNDIWMETDLSGSKYERAMSGVEGEIGFRPVTAGGPNLSNLDLRIYGTGFYYWADNSNNIRTGVNGLAQPIVNYDDRYGGGIGGEARFAFDAANPGSHLYVNAKGEYDNQEDWTGFLRAGVRIALGDNSGSPFTAIEQRLMDPVERANMLFNTRYIAPRTVTEHVYSAYSRGNEIIDSVYFADTRGTAANSGAEGDPTTIGEALDRAHSENILGEGDIIVVQSSDGDSGSGQPPNGLFAPRGVSLEQDDILLNASSSIELTGASTGNTGVYTPTDDPLVQHFGNTRATIHGLTGRTWGVVNITDYTDINGNDRAATDTQLIGIGVADGQVGINMANVEHNRFEDVKVEHMRGFGGPIPVELEEDFEGVFLAPDAFDGPGDLEEEEVEGPIIPGTRNGRNGRPGRTIEREAYAAGFRIDNVDDTTMTNVVVDDIVARAGARGGNGRDGRNGLNGWEPPAPVPGPEIVDEQQQIALVVPSDGDAGGTGGRGGDGGDASSDAEAYGIDADNWTNVTMNTVEVTNIGAFAGARGGDAGQGGDGGDGERGDSANGNRDDFPGGVAGAGGAGGRGGDGGDGGDADATAEATAILMTNSSGIAMTNVNIENIQSRAIARGGEGGDGDDGGRGGSGGSANGYAGDFNTSLGSGGMGGTGGAGGRGADSGHGGDGGEATANASSRGIHLIESSGLTVDNLTADGLTSFAGANAGDGGRGDGGSRDQSHGGRGGDANGGNTQTRDANGGKGGTGGAGGEGGRGGDGGDGGDSSADTTSTAVDLRESSAIMLSNIDISNLRSGVRSIAGDGGVGAVGQYGGSGGNANGGRSVNGDNSGGEQHTGDGGDGGTAGAGGKGGNAGDGGAGGDVLSASSSARGVYVADGTKDVTVNYARFTDLNTRVSAEAGDGGDGGVYASGNSRSRSGGDGGVGGDANGGDVDGGQQGDLRARGGNGGLGGDGGDAGSGGNGGNGGSIVQDGMGAESVGIRINSDIADNTVDIDGVFGARFSAIANGTAGDGGNGGTGGRAGFSNNRSGGNSNGGERDSCCEGERSGNGGLGNDVRAGGGAGGDGGVGGNGGTGGDAFSFARSALVRVQPGAGSTTVANVTARDFFSQSSATAGDGGNGGGADPRDWYDRNEGGGGGDANSGTSGSGENGNAGNGGSGGDGGRGGDGGDADSNARSFAVTLQGNPGDIRSISNVSATGFESRSRAESGDGGRGGAGGDGEDGGDANRRSGNNGTGTGGDGGNGGQGGRGGDSGTVISSAFSGGVGIRGAGTSATIDGVTVSRLSSRSLAFAGTPGAGGRGGDAGDGGDGDDSNGAGGTAGNGGRGGDAQKSGALPDQKNGASSTAFSFAVLGFGDAFAGQQTIVQPPVVAGPLPANAQGGFPANGDTQLGGTGGGAGSPGGAIGADGNESAESDFFEDSGAVRFPN